jgi:hypothetical protein
VTGVEATGPEGETTAGEESSSDSDAMRDAFVAARELRASAEGDAAEIRRSAEASADLTTTEANRFAAKRLQEVELLVGKAKRGLAAAEERSKVIVDTARAEAEKLLLAAREQARQIAAGGEPPVAPTARDRDSVGSSNNGGVSLDALASELDRMLAEALSKALDIPRHDPYPRRGPGRR